MSPEEELETFIKDRQEHVDELIHPALEKGSIVIVDRYFYSTAAYQGPRGLSVSDILAVNEAFAPVPDLLVHLDVPPRVGLIRIQLRGDRANHFEREEYLEEAAAIFRSLEGPFVLHLDAQVPVRDLNDIILRHLVDKLLFNRMCRKHYQAQCEPSFCSYSYTNQCLLIEVNRRLAKLSPEQEDATEVNRL